MKEGKMAKRFLMVKNMENRYDVFCLKFDMEKWSKLNSLIFGTCIYIIIFSG
jgi:hypothetical protein